MWGLWDLIGIRGLLFGIYEIYEFMGICGFILNLWDLWNLFEIYRIFMIGISLCRPDTMRTIFFRIFMGSIKNLFGILRIYTKGYRAIHSFRYSE